MSKPTVILILVLMSISWAKKVNPEINFPYSLGLLGFDYDPNFKHEEYTAKDIDNNIYINLEDDLPLNIDYRSGYTLCLNQINNIMDQGKCAASWAFAPLGVMSIQMCFWRQRKSIFKFPLSAEDLISCCDSCGKGCDGGYLNATFSYLIKKGVVTGSDYKTGSGCKPFSEGAFKYGITQRCKRTCQRKYRYNKYDEDLYVMASAKKLKSNPLVMQYHIYDLPSVIVSFAVYHDFANYRGGVYSRRKNAKRVGSHVVWLVGYGTENGVPYWLAANSWGTKWGMGGYFKIKRGTNECGIEQQPIQIKVDIVDYQPTIEYTTYSPDPFPFDDDRFITFDDDDFTTRNSYFTYSDFDDSDKIFSSAQTDTINCRLALGLMIFYFIFEIL